MTQMKQPVIEAKVDREIDERVKSGPWKAAKLTTFIALGYVMLGSLMGCPKPKGTIFPDKFWNRPGGDFEATSSASTEVQGLRAYEWGSTDQMVADVKMWLDNPSSNHGWLLMGNDNACQAI